MKAVQCELDLITALLLLAEMGLDPVPYAVRRSSARADFLRELVMLRPEPYRSTPNTSEALSAIADGLGYKSRKARNQVKLVLAEAALQVRDVRVAYRTCFDLMQDRYTGAAPLCEKVADTLGNQKANQELLANCLWSTEASGLDRVLSKWRRSFYTLPLPPLLPANGPAPALGVNTALTAGAGAEAGASLSPAALHRCWSSSRKSGGDGGGDGGGKSEIEAIISSIFGGGSDEGGKGEEGCISPELNLRAESGRWGEVTC
jgi:hypothetical protein